MHNFPVDSAMSGDELRNGYSCNDDRAAPQPGVQDEDESYAQLILRALQSRSNHTMTVQEIYQWFRENTEKGKADPEDNGWQNSIRHNLSMNEAFTKPDKKETSDGPETDAGTPRKSTEWVLAEWAIQKGIRSTTSYRPKSNADRTATSSHRSRGVSSRRGGNAAGKPRLAANRTAPRRHQQYGGALPSWIPHNDFPTYETLYTGAASMNVGQSGGSEPAPPPEVPGAELIVADSTMLSHPLIGSVASHSWTGQHQNVQLYPPIPGPYPATELDRLEFATRIYEVPSVQSVVSTSVEGSQLSQYSASFDELFTGVGESAQGIVMRGGNISYGCADGSQFQQ